LASSRPSWGHLLYVPGRDLEVSRIQHRRQSVYRQPPVFA
jgi:hypothetical protein